MQSLGRVALLKHHLIGELCEKMSTNEKIFLLDANNGNEEDTVDFDNHHIVKLDRMNTTTPLRTSEQYAIPSSQAEEELVGNHRLIANSPLSKHLSHYDEDDHLMEPINKKKQKTKKERAKTRDLVAFFICGLMNNYSYVIMLSAAGRFSHRIGVQYISKRI